MIFNADLHIHSKYSGGVSKYMDIPKIATEAKKKGIHIVATGDILHPLWIKQLNDAEKVDEGTFSLKGTIFVLNTEVEDNRRVHHLILFPSLSKVEEFRENMKKFSNNIDIDGRPKLHLNGEEIAQYAKDSESLIGPAHAFTPWTAMYAAYDSIHDCYGSLSSYVSFLELGLSADSSYADTIEEIRHLTYLTNSDAHSPYPNRLGREFNSFNIKEANFESIKKAILRKEGKIDLNVGFPPDNGKYNRTACISCYKQYSLTEAIMKKWKCSSCGKRIKKGVRDRVKELSSYEVPKHPDYRPPYLHLIPLSEIIAKAIGSGNNTKKVSEIWSKLIDLYGDEVKVLLEAPLNEIENNEVSKAIGLFREGKIKLIPGGGGRYGEILLEENNSKEKTNENYEKQKTIFEF